MTGVAKGVRHARLFSARCHLRRIPDTLPVHPIGDVPDRLYRRETWVNRTETGRLAATGGAKAVGAAQSHLRIAIAANPPKGPTALKRVARITAASDPAG